MWRAYDAVDLVVLIVVLGVVVLVLRGLRGVIRSKRAQSGVSYSIRPVMTKNQFSFHEKLVSALKECDVWPQVSMEALVKKEGKAPGSNKAAPWPTPHVNWVIGRKGKAFAIVELDDRTHQLAAARARADKQEEVLKRAGYRVIRFVGPHHDHDEIRRRVIPAAVRRNPTNTPRPKSQAESGSPESDDKRRAGERGTVPAGNVPSDGW